MSDSSAMPSPTGASFLRGRIEETAPDKLKAPGNIIQTVQGGKSIYFQFRSEHLKRIQLYAQIEGLLAGNPPYNPIELEQAKLSHIANFNNLDARSIYERGATAYWNLINESESLIKFTLHIDAPDAAKWGEIMSRHWSDVVRSWSSFNVSYNTLTGQLVRFGISPILWHDERDWRWRTVELSRFLVEDQAQTDISLVTCICVENIFTAQYLFEVYEAVKDKPAGTHPWNITELSDLLLQLANQFAKTDFRFIDMMQIQRHIQNGDLTYQAVFSDSIRLVSMFYQEYDGKISHYMFHPYYDSGNFLYFADRQYESMDEGILIFTASPGEFTIHSNRGLGHKIFSGAQAMMQLDCSIVDMARMSATPIIQTLQTTGKDFAPIRFYPGVPTMIGASVLQDNKLGANIQGLIVASQYILQKLNYNTANSGDDPSIPDRAQGSVTPGEAKIKSYREFAVPKNNICHFYSFLDLTFQGMAAKMYHSKVGYPGYEYVKLWKERCMDDGVPKEMFITKGADRNCLPDYVTVKASRVAGDGSTAGKIMGLTEIAPMVGTFGPKGRAAFQREAVLTSWGPDYVETFLSDSQVTDESQGGASLAACENGLMQLGISPVFSNANEQEAHFSTHMALGMHTIEQLQQQQLTTINADKIFTVLLPHMSEHWKALSESMFEKDYLEKMKKPWVQLSDYAKLNRKNATEEYKANIRKQQEQQQKTQDAMTDEQLKTRKAITDEKLATYKVQNQVQRAKDANVTRGEVMKEKVQEDANIGRMKVQLDHSVNTLKAQHEAVAAEPLPQLRNELSTINGQTPAPNDIENL